MFSIDMLPGGEGDCLWIEYGDREHPRRILIDGGTTNTAKQLRDRILSLDKPTFELIVVTHVDDDHIGGVLELFEDPEVEIDVADVWFNGQRAPGLRGIIQGIPQGDRLSKAIRGRAFPWNRLFKGSNVVVKDAHDPPIKKLPGGVTITLLSPGPGELTKLREVWTTLVERTLLNPLTPEVAITVAEATERRPCPPRVTPGTLVGLAGAPFRKDPSKANASSIAFLLEYDQKTVLFTGDCSSKRLEESIDDMSAGSGIKLQAMKMPHHGSRNNATLNLMNKIDCSRFLISTNGDKHCHPDAETIARIVTTRKKPTLSFNYRSIANEIWERRDFLDLGLYSVDYPADTGHRIDFD